jgi:hypothetical protein
MRNSTQEIENDEKSRPREESNERNQPKGNTIERISKSGTNHLKSNQKIRFTDCSAHFKPSFFDQQNHIRADVSD